MHVSLLFGWQLLLVGLLYDKDGNTLWIHVFPFVAIQVEFERVPPQSYGI